MFLSPWPALGIVLALGLSAPVPYGLPNCFDGTDLVVAAGGKLNICFTNPNLAGKTIQILIEDDDGNDMTVDIKLDDKGRGKRAIDAPPWSILVLQHPSSRDQGVVVL